MKQRTRNILEAADAALAGNAYGTLVAHGEEALERDLLYAIDPDWRKGGPDVEDLYGLRSLYLCLAAAACESGDLWV